MLAPVDHVAVFLDWQNVYMRARDSFHSRGDDFTCGQVHPVDLAEHLVADGPPDAERQLAQVRIYRGIPDQAVDERAYAAARRQVSAWEKDERVKMFTTKLRYPDGWTPGRANSDKPREKGIDVSLAVDLVTCGMDGMFDVGIVMSSDQDLDPALDYMSRRKISRNGPSVEVAAWRGSLGRRPNRIGIGGPHPPYCHWLSETDYWGLQDTRDYTHPLPTDHMPKRQ